VLTQDVFGQNTIKKTCRQIMGNPIFGNLSPALAIVEETALIRHRDNFFITETIGDDPSQLVGSNVCFYWKHGKSPELCCIFL
jgi:hypothetical protein